MPLKCEIVTQERQIFAGDVDYVSLPGVEGMMGILPNHSPLLTALDFGEVYIRYNGETQYFAVGGGFVEIQADKVIVLADSAARADEINLERAEEARRNAQRLIEEGIPDDPARYEQIEKSLRMAQLQLNIGRRRASQRRRPPQFDTGEDE